MKKLFITLFLTLSIVLTLSFNVNAIDTLEGEDLNVSSNWSEFVGPLAYDRYIYTYTVDIIADYSTYNYFKLTMNYEEELFNTLDLLYYNFSSTSTIIHNLHLDIGEDYWGTNIFYQVLADSEMFKYSTYDQLSSGNPLDSTAGVYAKTYALSDLTSNIFTLTYYTNYTLSDPPPIGYQDEIEATLNLKATNDIKPIYYTNGATTFNTSFYEGSVAEDLGYIPEREGSLFTGWKTNTNEFYDFEMLIVPEWLNDDGVFILYASYIAYNEGLVSDTDIDSNIPDNLSSFMSIFNADNSEGYMILFALLNIIIIVLSLLLKFKYYIPLLISMSLYAIWIFFGLLNVAMIIIIAMLYIVLLVGNLLKSPSIEGGI